MNIKSQKIQASSIISKLRDANDAYRKGCPFMSDTEYDNLLDEFRKMVEPEAYELVRTSLMESGGEVKHPYVMGSLDKIKAFDKSASIGDWIKKNVVDTGDAKNGIFISSKIDGCSARITYSNGCLVGAATRGDGYSGFDILSKALLFIPNTLNSSFSGDIRGEITLTNETFEELNEISNSDYKNIRNATAGLINSKDHTDEEYSFLRFFAYEIMGDNEHTKKEQFAILRKLGFETALFSELTDVFVFDDIDVPKSENSEDAIDRALLKIYNEFSEKAPFDIDGLVVTDLNNSHTSENVKIPESTVAVKFNQLTAKSKLIDVAWNVSKSGRLSPVGIIEPVELGGSTISNATLNNLHFIDELGLKLGCVVTILKSGDIIPKVVGVEHVDKDGEIDITFPKNCPSCGKPLQYDEDALFPMCVNDDCDGIVHAKVLHFLKQLKIKNVSLKTIAKFNLRKITDLLRLSDDGGLVKTKFIADINRLMFGGSKRDILCAFDYDGVSSKIIDKMIAHYGFDKLIEHNYEELSKNFPYGVGEKFLKKFCEGFANIEGDYRAITEDSRYYGGNISVESSAPENGGVLDGKGFVVTGALESMSRDEFKMSVTRNGGKYQSSVSKKTDYLVCNDESSATTKVNKAKALGVQVINETKFLAMIKDGSDGFAIF